MGGIDDLLLGYLPAFFPKKTEVPQNVLKVGDNYSLAGPIKEFRQILLTTRKYQLIVDIGCLQAWRRKD